MPTIFTPPPPTARFAVSICDEGDIVVDTPLYIRTEDGVDAAAIVTLPDGDVRAALLVASAGPSPRHGRNGLWRRVGHDLAPLGVATMRVDYPGVGLSAGTYDHRVEYSEATPLINVLRPAYHALAELVPKARMLVTGECLGARAALCLAADVDEPVAALLIDPLLFPAERVRQLLPSTAPPKPRRARRGPLWLLVLGKTLLRPVRLWQKRQRRRRPGAGADADAVAAFERAASRSPLTVVRSTGEPTAEYWERLPLPHGVRARIEIVDVAERIHNFGTLASQERCRLLVREWVEHQLFGE